MPRSSAKAVKKRHIVEKRGGRGGRVRLDIALKNKKYIYTHTQVYIDPQGRYRDLHKLESRSRHEATVSKSHVSVATAVRFCAPFSPPPPLSVPISCTFPSVDDINRECIRRRAFSMKIGELGCSFVPVNFALRRKYRKLIHSTEGNAFVTRPEILVIVNRRLFGESRTPASGRRQHL